MQFIRVVLIALCVLLALAARAHASASLTAYFDEASGLLSAEDSAAFIESSASSATITDAETEQEDRFLAELASEIEADESNEADVEHETETEAEVEADADNENENENDSAPVLNAQTAAATEGASQAQTAVMSQAAIDQEIATENEQEVETLLDAEEREKKRDEKEKKKAAAEAAKRAAEAKLTPLQKLKKAKKAEIRARVESAQNSGDSVLTKNPNHVHLHLTGNARTRLVTYVTPAPENEKAKLPPTFARWGLSPKKLNTRIKGTASLFKQSNKLDYQSVVHRVTLSNLKPGKTYYYQVGSKATGWSKVFKFSTASKDQTWAVFGDMGLENAVSLDRLKYEVDNGLTTGIVHIGDIGYDLDGDGGRIGDRFQTAIEPLTSRVPYIVGPGNHERWDNYTQYNGRFQGQKYALGKASGSDSAMYFSFNVPNAHFIVVNTEFFWPRLRAPEAKRMLRWLRKDLKRANEPKNRKTHPWIVVFGHKPTYHRQRGRAFFTLTDMLHKYGVDLYISGHQHNYARLYPNRGRKVQASQGKFLYTHPKFMSEIVIGSPGNKQKIEQEKSPNRITAMRLFKYGFGSLKIHNATHLTFNWKNTETGSKQGNASFAHIDDHLTIFQGYHGMRNSLLKLPQPDFAAIKARVLARRAAKKKADAKAQLKASKKKGKLSAVMLEQVAAKQSKKPTVPSAGVPSPSAKLH